MEVLTGKPRPYVRELRESCFMWKQTMICPAWIKSMFACNSFSKLTNGTLDIRLKDYADNYEKITIQAVDNAGNKSRMTQLSNHYYEQPKRMMIKTPVPAPVPLPHRFLLPTRHRHYSAPGRFRQHWYFRRTEHQAYGKRRFHFQNRGTQERPCYGKACGG